MKHSFLSILLSIIIFQLSAQNKYWVSFTNKGSNQFSLENPSEFLSVNALERRLFFNIPISHTDLPVNEYYIQQVQELSASAGKKSKWLNGAFFYSSNTNFINEVKSLKFVKRVVAFHENTQKSNTNKLAVNDEDLTTQTAEFSYGFASNQIEMLKGKFLHELGFQGQQIQIAVMDNGFENVNTNRFFDTANLENRIHGVYDFVQDTAYVFGNGDHGGYVMSTMAANIKDTLVGTAPMANYYLFSTENEAAEGEQEEINWAMAAEFADSALGNWVVLNTSLGYSNGFNDGSTNHTYQDMDGNTTIITKAADLAASKGMLVVNSAGNEGTGAWKYLTAPSDGDSVLAIGAVSPEGLPADFSSYGPSADGRIKPNVSAQGQGIIATRYDGVLRSINGTSFSGPITAGLAACLWQAFPHKTNMQIKEAIEQSAHLFYAPEEQYGFGIPNFEKAFQILSLNETVVVENDLIVYPNPVENDLHVLFLNNTEATYNYLIVDMGCKIWLKENNKTNTFIDPIGVANLPKGVYSIFIKQGKTKVEKKFVKR